MKNVKVRQKKVQGKYKYCLICGGSLTKKNSMVRGICERTTCATHGDARVVKVHGHIYITDSLFP